MGICIVDDSEISREVIKRSLKMYKHDLALEAIDGIDALEKIKKYTGKIDLYVLDVNMPNMDGITLIGEIRKFDLNTPIIMLTTETDKSKMSIAKEKGASGWVVKPFDAEKFNKIINMVLVK
ncbi:MAG: response regulator [Spirochaetaceae bacterium]